MMNILRNKLLKHLFGLTLISIMALKVCVFSISNFSSSRDPLAVEKSAAESKEAKEEAIEKTDKKLLTCQFSCIDHGHFLWTSHLPVSIYSYKMKIGNHPLITVPTPPPNHLV
ncbi:hypothetical protein ACSBL2_22450 [Pedobacter sp. AW31-3R]|uniref:hypothetical protein n=1 Tax=Pedobacter sp. AW31-3R TaxID=3445781 RepID=UPI003F9EF385